MIDKIYIFWLFLVVLWNIGYPKANPWLDILIAILLSVMVYLIRGKK